MKDMEKIKVSENEYVMPPDHGDTGWVEGAANFTRKEVAYLLYTQRAMIFNDLKRECPRDLPSEVYEVMENARIPNF